MTNSQELLCPCCDSHDTHFMGRLQDNQWFAGRRLTRPLMGGNLYLCRHCFLKFRHPVEDADRYEQLYDNTLTTTWLTETPRCDWDKIIDHFAEFIPHEGRVLDFGCYSGGLLAKLSPNYEKHGVEINRSAAVVAEERSQARIWRSLEDIEDLRFDIIIIADVIEHVIKPKRLIDDLLALLEEDGILIITTGDADNDLWNMFGANWWYCFFPEHISFVSEKWLRYISEASKLSILRCEKFHYRKLSFPRLVLDLVLVLLYGAAPRFYLNLGNALKKVLRRAGGTPVRGVGVSADHLFIVLTPKVYKR